MIELTLVNTSGFYDGYKKWHLSLKLDFNPVRWAREGLAK